MKKIVPLLLIIIGIGAGLWLYSRFMQTTTFTNTEVNPDQVPPGQQQAQNESDASNSTESGTTSASRTALINSATSPTESMDDVKPAAQAYRSAEDAVAAAIKGAKDFDDSVLEQFTEPGPDCSWCPQFYSSIQELVTNPNTPQDQKSYMAEILAISGRPDNVQVLVESIKNAPSSTEADIYAEALELTLGKDDVTKVLGEQLSTTNDTLRESSVAAITNQGTKLAAELLQKHIQERNDPDAYYSAGTGPGEFIPDEEALPYVQELVGKRDAYSPQWGKALINAGLPGLQAFFEQLENSGSPDSNRDLIKGALDHVNNEDGIKELTDNVIANYRSPEAIQFAKDIQQEFAQQEAEEGEGTTEP
jgi:hypothetical protein